MSMARSHHCSALRFGSSAARGGSRSWARRPAGGARRLASKLKRNWPDSGFQRRVPSQATTRSPSRKTLSRVSGRSPSWRRNERSARPLRPTGTGGSASARGGRGSSRSRKPNRGRPRRPRPGAPAPACTHCRRRPAGRPTIRAACAVSKRACAAARPRPATLLLLAARPRRPGRLLAGSAPSFLDRLDRTRLRATPLAAQALLQRLHQVDHLGLRGLHGRHRDLLAGDLLVDRLLQALAPLIVILLRREPVGGELLDQLAREVGLRRLHRRLRTALDLVEGAHLVGVVERVQREAVVERSDEDQPLLPARDVLGQRHHARVAHGLAEQLVRLVAALVRSEIVRVLKVHRIDVGQRHELLDVDRLARRRLERFQLLVGEEHELVLRHLAPLHQLAALDDALAARAPRLLLDARLAHLVNEVERGLLGMGGDVEAYRNGHQPEAHRRRPDRACWHGLYEKPSRVGLSNLDRDAPARRLDNHRSDVVPHGLGRARDVASRLCVVDHQLELIAACQRLEHDARLRPRQRAADAAQVERPSHGRQILSASDGRAPPWRFTTPRAPRGQRLGCSTDRDHVATEAVLRMDAYTLRPESFLLGGLLLLAAACAGPSPRSPGPDLVDLAAIDPSIRLDLRYATTDNFTGVAVYPVARCLLRRDAAERLARVQRRLRADGVGLLV